MSRYRRYRKPGKFADLQLGGHTIAVYWRDGLWEREDCHALWNFVALRIDLDIDLPPSQAQDALIHECSHAVSDIHGLNLSEKQVHALGIGLQQMLAPFLKRIR